MVAAAEWVCVMKKILISTVFAMMSTFFIFISPVFAHETGFLESEKADFLYLDTRTLKMNYDGENILFTSMRDGTLRLTSADLKYDYMSFIPYDGKMGGVGYAIRRIYTILPSMVFIEIIADVGAHAKNCGYWLIGKQNGQWVTYISIDNLAQMGYTPDKWHQIKTAANKDATGRFILTSQHEYMPPGAQYGYQRKFAVDLQLQIFWDQDAQWFGLRRL